MKKTIWHATVGGLVLALVGLGGWVVAEGGLSTFGGSVRAAEGDPIAYIGIDMDPTGNELPSAAGPGAQGPRDRCISKASGDPDFQIDVYADSIPLDEESTAYNYQLNWAPDNIDIVNPITDGMLTFGYYDPNPPYTANLNPGHANTTTQVHEPRPRAASPWNAGAANVIAGEQSWEGSQVVTRVSIKIGVGGPQIVNLWLNGAPLPQNIIGDDDGGYTNPVGAAIDGTGNPVQLAIDTACPEQPTGPATPLPAVTGTPTPGPTLAPSPSPAKTSVPTATPTAKPGLAATPSGGGGFGPGGWGWTAVGVGIGVLVLLTGGGLALWVMRRRTK